MAIPLETLLEEAKCFCPAGGSTAERAIMALLQRIAEAGGSGGGGAPGGPLNAVQFQSPLGVFAGSSDLTFNDATNVLALTGTLNSTTVLLGNGALATPSLSFASETNLGIYRVGALRIGFVTNGNLRGEFNNAIFELKAAIPLSFNSSTFLRGDDAANEIAQRNGAGAQFYKLYRTFTNSTNYERLSLGSAAGQMVIAAETQGTGTDDLDLSLVPAGVGRVTLPGGAQLLKTTAAMTSGPGAAVGTLTDAPSAGNPDVWCPIMFNGVQHWFPCWA